MLYKFVWTLIKIFYTIYFRLQVIGADNVPKTGSCVLCANHTSNFDPTTLAVSIKRLPRFMAKKELFEVPGLSWLLRNLKAFPVDRQKNDMNALKTAINVLKSGEMIGIFAQGRRVKEGEDPKARAGVALIALKGDAPVVPTCISSSYKPFSKVTIIFGEPITLEEYKGKKVKTDELNEITEMIMEKINLLEPI